MNNGSATSCIKIRFSLIVFFMLLAILNSEPLRNENKFLSIYIDADRTVNWASGNSIEQGIRTALSEENDRIDGYQFKIASRDHRGSSPRSKKHLQEFLNDDHALVVFGGLHSPPILAHRKFINKNKILFLDPWAAAGPITRYPAKENWIFRLSVDDNKAGFAMVDYAIKTRGFQRPFLLLEHTSWGKSNKKTIKAALRRLGLAAISAEWFNWQISDTSARILIRKAVDADADVILLVANALEGKTFSKAILDMGIQIPICSHWGITGADFPEIITQEMRRKLDLHFIQTRFSFSTFPQDSLGIRVLQQARLRFPETIKQAQDIKAPPGFIHAYDLTKIFISAVKQAGLTGDMTIDRNHIRQALENLKNPVKGLIKEYRKPFGVFSSASPDAHEALGLEDIVMASYDDEGNIILETKDKAEYPR